MPQWYGGVSRSLFDLAEIFKGGVGLFQYFGVYVPRQKKTISLCKKLSMEGSRP